MNTNKLLTKYNQPDTLLVISLYPKKGEVYSSGVSGVASYTKNVVSNMDRNVVVLADYRTSEQMYQEKNVLVVRCFHKNSPTMYGRLLHALTMFPKAKTLMVQFDFSLYGGMITTASMLPFLALLRVLGYKVHVVSHHVVSDIRNLSGHVGLGKNIFSQMKASVYNALFHLFYTGVGYAANNIIVLEETLKAKLTTQLSHATVVAIPHGVDTSLSPISKAKARKKLGIPMNDSLVLFFGYVNWFKGADFFVNAYKDKEKLLGRPAHFYLAGGPSATLRNKGYYQKYYDKVEDVVYDSKHITMTGYVPQEDIATYFSAADLVVFPYRHFMTASGVLSLTFSYQKPFIISNKLEEMFSAEDLTKACKNTGLTHADLMFDLTYASCISATERVLLNGLKKKMIALAKEMRAKRSYQNIAMIYDATLFPTVVPTATLVPQYSILEA